MTIQDVEVGSADPRGARLDRHFVGGDSRDRQIPHHERLAHSLHHGGFHLILFLGRRQLYPSLFSQVKR
jgi:hypothetical protein